MIATCPKCRNIGAIGERYCDCPVADALRASIDSDPAVQAARAQIDRLLDQQAEQAVTFEPSHNRIKIVLPSTGTIRVSTAGNSAVNSTESPSNGTDDLN